MSTTRIAGVVAGLALATSALAAMPFTAAHAVAPGTGAEPAACAQQERQVDRAEKALEKVTAVFAKQRAKADTKAEKAEVQEKTAKAKKAQVQRLAKAEARLAACEDAQGDTATG